MRQIKCGALTLAWVALLPSIAFADYNALKPSTRLDPTYGLNPMHHLEIGYVSTSQSNTNSEQVVGEESVLSWGCLKVPGAASGMTSKVDPVLSQLNLDEVIGTYNAIAKNPKGPKFIPNISLLTSAAIQSGKSANEVVDVYRAIADHPKSPRDPENVGLLTVAALAFGKSPDEAVRVFRKIADDPNGPHSHSNVGLLAAVVLGTGKSTGEVLNFHDKVWKEINMRDPRALGLLSSTAIGFGRNPEEIVAMDKRLDSLRRTLPPPKRDWLEKWAFRFVDIIDPHPPEKEEFRPGTYTVLVSVALKTGKSIDSLLPVYRRFDALDPTHSIPSRVFMNLLSATIQSGKAPDEVMGVYKRIIQDKNGPAKTGTPGLMTAAAVQSGKSADEALKVYHQVEKDPRIPKDSSDIGLLASLSMSLSAPSLNCTTLSPNAISGISSKAPIQREGAGAPQSGASSSNSSAK